MRKRAIVQNFSMCLENYYQCGFGGIRFPHVKGFEYWSFKDYLISQIIAVLGAGPRVPVLLEAL
jgi:hypothetical protein